MSSKYDEWKTTEPDSAECDFLGRRTDELITLLRKDKDKVTEVISDLLSDDVNDFFSEKMARLFIAVDQAEDDRSTASAGADLWSWLDPMVMNRINRDAEVAAQAEWDARLTEKPHDDL